MKRKLKPDLTLAKIKNSSAAPIYRRFIVGEKLSDNEYERSSNSPFVSSTPRPSTFGGSVIAFLSNTEVKPETTPRCTKLRSTRGFIRLASLLKNAI